MTELVELPAVSPIVAEVLALLQGIEHLNVYEEDAVPVELPRDNDGRVHPYVVYYPGGGRAFGDRLNKDTPTDVIWTCRILLVGGDKTRAAWTVDKVRAELTGTRLSNGARLKEALDDVIFRVETNVVPSRTSGLIIYRLHI